MKKRLDNFSKFGEKECQMKCDREVIMTKTGSIIICHGCERIVMDNRK